MNNFAESVSNGVYYDNVEKWYRAKGRPAGADVGREVGTQQIAGVGFCLHLYFPATGEIAVYRASDTESAAPAA